MSADEFWGTEAPCSGSTDVFFPVMQPGATWAMTQAYSRAKEICATCPFVFECLERWNAAGRPGEGVWFGTTPIERRSRPDLRACSRCGKSLELETATERRLLHPECAEAKRAERYQRSA